MMDDVALFSQAIAQLALEASKYQFSPVDRGGRVPLGAQDEAALLGELKGALP
jgi:hypothetical protein